MPSKRRAAAAKKKVDDDEEDFNEEEEEDEDDEFMPGMDDDEELVPDDDDEDEEDEEDILILDGQLHLHENLVLQYQGEGFDFTATVPAAWNVLDRKVQPPSDFTSWTCEMNGTCEILAINQAKLEHKQKTSSPDAKKPPPSSPAKPTPRKLQVTWSKPDESSSNPQKSPVKGKKSSDDEEDDDDDDNPRKLPSLLYHVYGQEVLQPNQSSNRHACLEFRGTYQPGNGKNVSLQCQARFVEQAAPLAAAASPAAAARPTNEHDDDADEQEVLQGADDAVDYNELIALHEDAGQSVEAVVQKRYRSNGEGSASSSSSAKRPKRGQPDDDDDEYGF